MSNNQLKVVVLVAVACVIAMAYKTLDVREENLQLCHQLGTSLEFLVDFEADSVDYYPTLNLDPIKAVLAKCPNEKVPGTPPARAENARYGLIIVTFKAYGTPEAKPVAMVASQIQTKEECENIARLYEDRWSPAKAFCALYRVKP